MTQEQVDQGGWEGPIACTLGMEDRRQRGDEITRIFVEGRPQARQLPDGYALRFPGTVAWAARLLTFIMGERVCCPFFTFELVFEPDQGPIVLTLRGPAGTTDFVADLLTQTEGQDPEGSNRAVGRRLAQE